ncbi:NFAT activation molecule 1, partial [Acanthisitta chloris]
KYTKFLISYYWINSLGQETSICNISKHIDIPSGQENKTATRSYIHRLEPLESTSATGTYYCKVKWDDIQKRGNGVFVLARGTGHTDTSSGWEMLITLTTVLAALSITATALLLWKRKAMCHLVSCPEQVLCPRRNQLNILKEKVETQLPSARPPPPPPP